MLQPDNQSDCMCPNMAMKVCPSNSIHCIVSFFKQCKASAFYDAGQRTDLATCD